jgi:5-methylcytosine-specific restriction endonuclease McrA
MVDVIEPTPGARPHAMREPCKFCGEPSRGTLARVGGQNVVRCAACGRAVYNAPRTETGEAQRSVLTVHNSIKPKTRAAVILRANRRCELCGAPAAGTEGLMVDHMLSVDDGLKLGLSEAQLNDLSNLAALCPACNLGKGRTTLPLYLVIAILQARTASGDADQ